jgi:ankyrin repeat protein
VKPEIVKQFLDRIPNTQSMVFGYILGKPCLPESISRSPHAIDVVNSAVHTNSIAFLEAMMERGVPVNGRATTCETLSPLEVACTSKRTTAGTLKHLLQYTETWMLDELDHRKEGLIHRLIKPDVSERELKLKALLEKGADPNLMRWGKAPALVSFILDKQEDLAMILLNHGADPAATTRGGMDASLAAASRGNIRILAWLKTKLEGSGYDWARTCRSHFTIKYADGTYDTTVASGCNALHLASFNGHDMVLEFYFQNFSGVKVNAKVDDHQEPLHFAAVGGSLSCVDVLANHGAKLDAQTVDGSTPLHLAVRKSQAQSVKLLLRLGPSNLVDNGNLTPFCHALRIGSKEIVEMFVDPPQISSFPKHSAKRKVRISLALEMAISSGDRIRCVNLLEATSAEEIRSASITCGQCPALTFAIRRDGAGIVQWLLDLCCRRFIGSCSRHSDKNKRGFNALNDVCEKTQLQACISPILDAYLEAGIPWPSMAAGALHSCAMSDNVDGINTVVQHIKANALKYR